MTARQSCQPRDCNSPIANSFPINGLTTTGAGACNPEHTQLMPGSLSGGGCGSGADLTVEATPGLSGLSLVGKRDGKIVCRDRQLEGATFRVRSYNEAVAVFTIDKVEQVKSNVTDLTYEAYRIEVGRKSACESEVADSVRLVLGLSTHAKDVTVPGYKPDDDDLLVMVVPGPLYDRTDTTITGISDSWFNLACVRDGLAKRLLWGLYKTSQNQGPRAEDSKNETALRNETALKVITARYCNTRAYTMRGATFRITRPPLNLDVEARWKGGRAVCLKRPRALMIEGVQDMPGELPDQLQPVGCGGSITCNRTQWIAALRKECGLGPKDGHGPKDCHDDPSSDFESMVVGADIKVLTKSSN